MTIRENFPFETCQDCNEFVLDVEEKVLFCGEHTQRELVVSCKHSDVCRKLAEKFGVKTNEE